MIAPCTESDLSAVNTLTNQSAQAYKGIIPMDRWHDPYMPMDERRTEITSGVCFHGYYLEQSLIGVMGIQAVQDVTLIRHAYVKPEFRGRGIGRLLLEHLKPLSSQTILIGTWKAAEWAVSFYQKNGFRLVAEDEKNRLLKSTGRFPSARLKSLSS